MRRLKRLIQCAAALCALLACAGLTDAQVPYPGYVFVEVTDEADRPVFGATAVAYSEAGDEVGSSVTDSQGKAPFLRNRDSQEHFVVRVVKPGYLTYEGVAETSGQYNNAVIKIKLVSMNKSKANGARRVSLLPAAPKRVPP